MKDEPKIKKVLVVLSPDLIRPDDPLSSMLLKRAVSLAKATGCELELFHACYEGRLDFRIAASDDELALAKRRIMDSDATKLAEIAARLKNENIEVRYEVRWDYPRTDAILRKIEHTQPDIVMKQSREHSYVLGISSNTDWDLARRSPVHVWLVNDSQEDINRVVAAIGNKLLESVDVTTGKDHTILRAARAIADTFKAELHPVNAYQLPASDAMVAGANGIEPPVVLVQDQEKTREQMIENHKNAIHALAQFFLIKPDNIHVLEGHPNRVITDVAEQVDTDMIAIGASSISRMERVVSAVTVEPVMAATDADIFIVRDGDWTSIPNAKDDPMYGIPKYNLERAITNPAETFRSPQQVVDLNEVSIGLRQRILQAWEHDIRAEMVEENEGGPVRETDADALKEVSSAIEEITMRNDAQTGDKARRLSIASK